MLSQSAYLLIGIFHYIGHYEKMFDKDLLPQDKYNSLLDHWNKMENNTCPRCGNGTLEWHIIADNQGSELYVYQ